MAVGCLPASAAAQAGQPPAEVRGVWITNTDTAFFDARANVARGIERLAAAGINVVFPVVWSKGYTLFPSEVLRRELGRDIDPRYAGRDPLAEVLFEAHRHGIEVIPWFEYGFTAGHQTLGAPLLDARPDWAAIGADGAPLVKNGFHWLDPLDPEVQAFMTDLVLEVCARYDVDGVQGDDRLPAMPCEAGYDDATRAAWRAHAGRDLPRDPRDPEFTRWRAEQLTAYLAALRRAVKASGSELLFSMAPGGPGWAYREYLQDQAAWLERGLVDTLHPQLYARDLPGYRRMVAELLAVDWIAERRALVSPGLLVRLGSWRARPELLAGAIRENRARGLAGEVHFFHQGLLDEDGARLTALARGPYRERAVLPWRRAAAWRPAAVEVEPVPLAGAPRERELGGRRVLELGGGEPGAVAWDARVEVGGAHRAFVWLPAATEGELGFTLADRAGPRPAPLAADRADAAGWVELGPVELEAGEPVRVLTLEVDGAATVAVGALLLLADRRSR